MFFDEEGLLMAYGATEPEAGSGTESCPGRSWRREGLAPCHHISCNRLRRLEWRCRPIHHGRKW